jgi:ATP-dependent helicase/nuclease subunit A
VDSAAPLEYLALPAWTPARTAAAAPALPGQPEAARLGEALHRVLEWATQPSAGSLGALCSAATTAFGLDEAAQARLLHHARTVLDSPAARRFFDPAAIAWAGNEVSVADGAALLRIDRLVALDEGGRRTWWVLDYKLQSAPAEVAAYREQIERYRRLVQALQPADEVRAAFITAAGEVVAP